MSRIPTTQNTEIINIRVSKSLKEKLKKLADRNKYGANGSEVIRYLIERAYFGR